MRVTVNHVDGVLGTRLEMAKKRDELCTALAATNDRINAVIASKNAR